MKILLRAFLISILVAVPLGAIADPSFRTVATFAPDPAGSYLTPRLVLAPGGNYYGTTGAGGTFNSGTIFMLTPAGVLTTLASFDPKSVGESPSSLLLGKDGNLYGVCALGGSSGLGSIFKMTPDGTLTALHTFSGPDGEYPYELVQGSDGSLYTSLQTTSSLFTGPPFIKISTMTGAITVLNPAIGYFNNDNLEISFQNIDGYFYGMLNGSIVKVSTSGVITTLAFLGTNEGPGLFPGPNGTIYGATLEEGLYHAGSIFQLSATGVVNTLVSFNPSAGPSVPLEVILGSDGHFYGTAQGPGENFPSDETIFEATSTGTVTTLATGASSLFGIVRDANGDVVWEANGIDSSIQIISNGTQSTLYAFTPHNIGAPTGPLLEGKDGNFYGTASQGGPSGHGGVYKVTPAGQLTTLASFGQNLNLSSASYPLGLTQATDGSFYGVAATNSSGLQPTYGFIYNVGAEGVVTQLATFPGEQSAGTPVTRLIQGADGNFYGLTSSGGLQGEGTFYKVTPSGTLTVVASLAPSLTQSGSFSIPVYQFLLGKDGNFYAATEQSIFRITPAGKVTSLINFPVSLSFASIAMLQGADGNFYGLGQDVNNLHGYLFRLTPKGVMSIVYGFGTLYSSPLGIVDTSTPTSLALGHDGNFYVTAPGGYAYDYAHVDVGVLLQITPNGAATPISFGSTPGDAPQSIIQGTDGTLYGVNELGGTAMLGSIFNVNPDLLSGTVIGTPGTFDVKLGANTIENVFDGDLNTFFDAPKPGNGDWVGIDLGSSGYITSIAYVPRTHYESRMLGGVFQGSNTPDFSSGVVNLTGQITTFPGDRFNTIVIPTSPGTTFRYVRYLSPTGGFGNISELEFFSNRQQWPRTGDGGG